MAEGVLVIGEMQEGGLMYTTTEQLAAARQIVDAQGGLVYVALFGEGAKGLVQEAIVAGADLVYTEDNPRFTVYVPGDWLVAAQTAVEMSQPSVVMLSSTTIGHDLAPRLASRLNTGVASNVASFEIVDGTIRWTQLDSYGHPVVRTFDDAPQIVALRHGSSRPLLTPGRIGDSLPLNVELPEEAHENVGGISAIPTDQGPSNSAPGGRTPDPRELIVQLFSAYTANSGEVLPPLETSRWDQLVSAILMTYSQSDISESVVGQIVDTLASIKLLELETLAGLSPWDDDEYQVDRIIITLDTIIRQYGLSTENTRRAIVAICESASVFHNKYRGNVQTCLRNHGQVLLNDIMEEISFRDNEAAREFLAIWLQHTVNMPIPASTKVAAAASAALGVSYDSLIEAADSADLHIGWLDDVLRTYVHNQKRSISVEHAAGEETP